MRNEKSLIQIPRSLPYFDYSALAIINRSKSNRYKRIAFWIYILTGIAVFALGGYLLATNGNEESLATLGYAVLAFGVSILAMGFTFIDSKRDQELEDVTAGIYTLLRNCVIPGETKHHLYKFVSGCCDFDHCDCQPDPCCSCGCYCTVVKRQPTPKQDDRS